MLSEKIDETGANVYLVNTGWCGGKAGTVGRMKLRYTRAMVTAALNGSIEKSKFVKDPYFGVSIPTEIENVPSEILIPANVWKDEKEYEATAKDLASRFVNNFKKYTHMSKEVVDAGPRA
jgi:phosphoenolpyruvate carboxykinase (ATP)